MFLVAALEGPLGGVGLGVLKELLWLFGNDEAWLED